MRISTCSIDIFSKCTWKWEIIASFLMEKCTVRIAVLAIFFQIQICTSFNIYNNACENYNEYFVRFWSTRCYYNPDVLSDTVSTWITRARDYFSIFNQKLALLFFNCTSYSFNYVENKVSKSGLNIQQKIQG